MKLKALAALFALTPTIAAAVEPSATTGTFKCYTKAAFQDFGAGKDVKVNNFSIDETKAFLAPKQSQVQISFSIVNRSQANAYVAAQFILMDGTGPIAALTAAPLMDVIAPGQTETAKGSVFVDAGTLKQAVGICVQIKGAEGL